jgi:hypothetical protein
VLFVGLLVLIALMPDWAFAVLMLPLALGWLWFLIYRLLEMREKAREAREVSQKAALEARREADQLKQERR